jgi:hypothetical protein
MVYRKGELSKGMMDRQWPHQVSLPASRRGGDNDVTIRLFCDERQLSLCTRAQSFHRDDTNHIVFCFADRAHAEQFREQSARVHQSERPPGVAGSSAVPPCSPTIVTRASEASADTRPTR